MTGGREDQSFTGYNYCGGSHTVTSGLESHNGGSKTLRSIHGSLL